MASLDADLHGGLQGLSLAPGAVLASRYRIVSFLGRGAVGEVYEAEDLELGEEIAVKVLRPEIARDERVLQRFKREIQLARRVTHPNVCRVFDLVYHLGEGGAGAPPAVVFLTMELLRGETLEERLAREGRLTTAEALPVIGHVAAALTAAHGNGVVHRDLKSGNVFLVPGPSGTRAVVTDFGLAWSSMQEESAASLTATGELVGSPAYMAPEQVRGEEATPATDVYALGVVMFEIITGELPFVGKSAFYTALKRLQEPAPSPRVHLSDLDPAWEKTILRCLERDPADRFKSVRHVVRSLGATKAEEDATSPVTLVRDRRLGFRFPWRAAVGIAAGVLFLVGVLGLLRARRAADAADVADAADASPATRVSAPRAAAAAIPVRPSVAVLPFDDLSETGEGSGGLALFELLPLELAASGKLRVVPPEEVDRVIQDLGPPEPTRAASAVPRLGKRLEADFLVGGAFLAGGPGKPTRYDALVWDARTGRRVAALTESGEAALESLGRRLRVALGAGELPSFDEETLRASLPKPAAAALYAEALNRLRRSDAPAARDLLRKAVAREPDQPLLRSALARAWQDLGSMQEALREAKQAFTGASGLRREDRLAIEAQYHEMAEEWEEAAVNYQEIAAAAPDDLEAGLRLAAVQTRAGQSAAVKEALDRLRLLPPPLGDDPRIALAEAAAADERRDFTGQRAAADQALQQARARGDRVLTAEAQLEQGGALVGLRDFNGAFRVLEEAKQTLLAAGRPRSAAEAVRGLAAIHFQEGRPEAMRASLAELAAIFHRLGAELDEARALNLAGNLHNGAGDRERAESYYRQALVLARKVGDRKAESSLLHNLATLTLQRGQLAEAKELFRQALARHRELGYAKGEGASLQGLGMIAYAQGDLLVARSSYQQARAVYQRMGAEESLPEVLNNLAEVSFALGELTQARRERESARDLALRTHQDEQGARALGGIADVLRQQGDLARARKLYERSLAAYHRLGSLKEADVQDEIGWTLTLQGDLTGALKRFQQALAAVRERKQLRPEAVVLAHRSQALWRWGEAQEARAAQQRSIEISRQIQEPSFVAEGLVGLGRIQCDRNELAAARKSFEEALAIFRRRGEPSGVASALYGLGEVLLRQGFLEQARQQHEEGLTLRTRLGEQLAAAESRLALAGVALSAGQAAQAEAAARRELATFRKLANLPGEAAATLLLARSLLAQGRTAAARSLLQSSAPLLDSSQEPAVGKAAAELRTRAVAGPGINARG